MNKAKKHVLLAVTAGLFLSACAPFRMGDIRIGDTRARRIAKDSSIPGKYDNGACLHYARALQRRFRAAGIPSKVVSFHYETLPVPQPLFGDIPAFPSLNERGGFTGDHAVVVYEDLGRTYVMDNQSWQPRWIHQSSPSGMMEQFSGMHTMVADAQVLTESRHSGSSETRLASRRPPFRETVPALRPQLAMGASFSAWHRSPCGLRPITNYGMAHYTPLFRATSI